MAKVELPAVGEACGNCRFWEDIYLYPNPHIVEGTVFENAYDLDDCGRPGGNCRRFPPAPGRPGPGDDYVYGEFPAVGAAQWCGEWRPTQPAGVPTPWEEFVGLLSVRARRCMGKRGIDSWEKLTALRGGDEPLTWRDFGVTTYHLLREAMKRAGVEPPAAWKASTLG